MKKVLKRILIITLLFFTAFIIGFFVYSWISLNSGITDINAYVNTYYATLDQKSYVAFGDLNKILFVNDNKLIFFNSYHLESEILTLKNDELSYTFSLIDSETIYNYDLNLFLYKVVN